MVADVWKPLEWNQWWQVGRLIRKKVLFISLEDRFISGSKELIDCRIVLKRTIPHAQYITCIELLCHRLCLFKPVNACCFYLIALTLNSYGLTGSQFLLTIFCLKRGELGLNPVLLLASDCSNHKKQWVLGNNYFNLYIVILDFSGQIKDPWW